MEKFLRPSQIISMISLFIMLGSGCSTTGPKANRAKFISYQKEHPELIWTEKLADNTKNALRDYRAHLKLKNGKEYGDSVRNFSLANKTAADIDVQLQKMECLKKEDYLKNPKTQAALQDAQGHSIPMWVYLCDDGGVVRVKPVGDPTSKFRPQPGASKALRYPSDSKFETFSDEALKVDNEGNPIPKWVQDMNIPDPISNFSKSDFIEGWAEDAHTDLIATPPPH